MQSSVFHCQSATLLLLKCTCDGHLLINHLAVTEDAASNLVVVLVASGAIKHNYSVFNGFDFRRPSFQSKKYKRVLNFLVE